MKWNLLWTTFFLIVFSLHRNGSASESPREAEGNAMFCWSLRSICNYIFIEVETRSKSLSFSDSPDCCMYCAFCALTPYSTTWNHIFGFNYRSMSGIKEISLNFFFKSLRVSNPATRQLFILLCRICLQGATPLLQTNFRRKTSCRLWGYSPPLTRTADMVFLPKGAKTDQKCLKID